MGRHVKLPSLDEKPKKRSAENLVRKQVQQNSPEAMLADRAQGSINGERVYCLRVKMDNSSLGGFIFLSHAKKFDQSVLETMLSEAVTICNNTRIPSRRQIMADQKTPVEDPVKLNETWFVGDVDFVEAVMCDKWEFKKLFYSTADGVIVPTVLVKSA